MITYKTQAEIEKMRRAGQVLFAAMKAVKSAIRPGVTTAELDRVAESVIRSHGAIPSEKGYEGFPGSICASPDDMVVIIHLIDMVTGKDQYIIRVILLHISQILIDRIGSSCVPFTACALLIRRKDCDTTFIAVKIPRNTDTDMCIQAERLVLCQHTHRVNSRVNTIAQWKIDDTIFTTKSDCRLCNLFCQNS